MNEAADTVIRPGGGFLGCSHPDRRSVRHKLSAQLVQPDAQAMVAATGTTFFPDVSGYQAGLRVQPGTAALLAKSTEGSTFTDGAYQHFRAQATSAGAVFGAYHFLWGGSMAEARHCHDVVGSTPLMLDVENTNVALRLADVLSFVANYRSLGGVVHLAYLPQWYWSGTMGGPPLAPLAQAGVRLVSSNYTGYSDSGPGWAAYGGVAPVQWQYTDALPYGGQAVDFNAYKGTAAGYAALLTGQGEDPNVIKDDPDAWAEALRMRALCLGATTSWTGSNADVKQIWPNVALQQILANQAAEAKKLDAATTAINALAAAIQQGGGSVDTVPIVAAINQLGAQESAAVTALHAELAAYRAAQVAGAQAEADALKS